MKIAFDGHPLRGRPAEMTEVVAKEHDAVGVIDDTIGGDFVACRATVLGDVDFLCLPQRLQHAAAPSTSPRGRAVCHDEAMRGCDLLNGMGPISRRLFGSHHIDRGPVYIDADEIDRRGDDLQVLVGEFRRILAGRSEIGVGVRPSRITVR